MSVSLADFTVLLKQKQLLENKVKVATGKDRAMFWALNYHANTRSQKMEFGRGAYYLYDLYQVIGNTPFMVVEKSVQCFLPDTRVTTPFGYRSIKDIRVGDLVLTHEGRYCSVTKVFKNKHVGKCVSLRSDLMESVVSTFEHPFLSYKYSRYRYHHIKFDKVFGKVPVWVDSNKVLVGDFICRAKIPSPSGELRDVSIVNFCDRRIEWDEGDWFREKWGQRETIAEVQLDYGFGRLVGLYLSEGWVNATRLCFGFHKNEVELENIIREQVSLLIRGKDPVNVYVNDKDNCRRVFVSSYTLVRFFKQFGTGCVNKVLPKDWLAFAPLDFLRGVFDGSMLGDGHFGAQNNYRTVSKDLAFQISFIGSMLNRYSVVRSEIRHGRRKAYSVVFGSDKKYTRHVDINDKHLASRVRKHTEIAFDGFVYNLQVEDDNSYVANDYVVHNCGLSELFIIQSHIEAGEYGMTVMYVLPKYELRNRFVNNRIYKIHKRMNHYSYMVLQSQTKVHRTSLMHFGSGTLAYVGSNVQDEFIEIPVDSAYIDEKDRCNLSNLLMLPDRLTASPYGYEREISNPTIEGFGINERYSNSSQGKYNLKCPACGKWFVPDFFKHAVEEVGLNVYVPRDPNADPDPLSGQEIKLIHDCGSPVDRLKKGEWVHGYPDRKWKGYSVSKLFAQLNRNATLRALYSKWSVAAGNELKMQIFMNSDLGLAFSSKGAKINRGMLNACRRPYAYPVVRVKQSRSLYMGIDVGENLHIILREKINVPGEGPTMRLVGLWAVSTFGDAVRILKEWKPKCCVIDAMPEIHKVMDLKNEFSNVWSSRFQIGVTSMVKHKATRELRMDRTALLDYVRQGTEEQRLTLPMQAESLENGEYYEHLMAPTRVLEPNEIDPEKSRFVWREGSKPDHFFLAEAYCIQAGMTMPDQGIFDFFDRESGVLTKFAEKQNVPVDGLTDKQRIKISELQRLTPQVAINKIMEKNLQEKPIPTRHINKVEVRDIVLMMFEGQGYVDLALAVNMSKATEPIVLDILEKEGFEESRIAGQYVKC